MSSIKHMILIKHKIIQCKSRPIFFKCDSSPKSVTNSRKIAAKTQNKPELLLASMSVCDQKINVSSAYKVHDKFTITLEITQPRKTEKKINTTEDSMNTEQRLQTE